MISLLIKDLSSWRTWSQVSFVPAPPRLPATAELKKKAALKKRRRRLGISDDSAVLRQKMSRIKSGRVSAGQASHSVTVSVFSFNKDVVRWCRVDVEFHHNNNNNNLPENEMKQNSAVSSQESARVGAHCTILLAIAGIVCADMSSVKWKFKCDGRYFVLFCSKKSFSIKSLIN